MISKITLVSLMFILTGSVSAQVLTDSNLPIIIINTDGGVEIGFGRVLGSMKIIYRGEGKRTYISDQNNAAYINYDGRIDVGIRGNSTLLESKSQYRLTTREADNTTNNNVSILGMPEENDWILNGMACDPARIRDYLAYNLSRQTGEYASRAVYCELIINGKYRGLYLLAEKIKADDNRVNVIKIESDDILLPEISGGYITAAEEAGTSLTFPLGWTMQSWQGTLVSYIHILPKPEEIKPAQHDYIRNQFLSLENMAQSGNVSKTNGFPSIIDVPSFTHFMIINEIASNPDAYWGSTYFHKDRNGKLRAGPVWDFDFAFGNYRSKTDVWQFSGCDGISMSDNGGSKFWKSLFDNPLFGCYMSKRWNELTQPGQPLNLSSIEAFIDKTVATISEAVVRDFALWGIEGTHLQNVSALKAFLAARIPWMTANLGPCSSCIDVPVPPLVITKIMYHPGVSVCSSDDDDLEFLEITNNSDKTIDLTGIYFGGTGFVYQFPVNSKISPHSSVILASNASCFQKEYGFAPFGQFTRHLSNKSENLLLSDAFGNVIDNVTYSDSTPWPDADGNGYYLMLTDINLDNSIAGNWRISNDKTKIINNNIYPIVKKCPPDTVILEGLGQKVPSPVTALQEFLEGGGYISDKCGIASFYYTENKQGTDPTVIVRTYTVTDSCGNSDFCQQTIRVYRKISLTCPPTISVSCAKPAPYNSTEEFIKAGGTLNIPIGNISTFKWEGDISDNKKCPETISREYHIVDIFGQQATGVHKILINDTNVPVFTKLPKPVISECVTVPYYRDYTAFYKAGDGAKDDCGVKTETFTLVKEVILKEKCPKILVRTYSIGDWCGNLTFFNDTLTIRDVVPSEMIMGPLYTQIISSKDIPPPFTLEEFMVAIGYTTYCGIAKFEMASQDSVYTGTNIKVTRNYRITDICGVTHEGTHVIDMISTGTEIIREKSFRYSIIPNPNRGKFIFRIDSNFVEDLTVKLSNPLGQVIETRSVKSTGINCTEQFNVMYLSKGVYFLVISSGDFQKSEKIVIQ
jgi:hypothetical protein